MPNTKPTQDEPHGKLDDAREAASHAYDAAVTKASTAIETSKDVAEDAFRRTAATFDANPLGIVAGGLAIGALAGALIPRSAKEKELLAPIGAQIAVRARGAIQAAREAGGGELEGAGLTKDAAKDQVKTLLQGVAKALQTAGSAAAKSAANKG